MSPIREFLESQGYQLVDQGEFFRTKALYRNGDGWNLSINKKTGAFKDWVTGETGDFKKLTRLVSGETLSAQKLNAMLEKLEGAQGGQKIKVKKYLDESLLETHLPDYQFFLRRKISEKTQKLFRVGLCTSGKLNNRYVIPIFCYRTNKLIGMTGRYYLDEPPKNVIKWKHINPSSSFLFPMYINDGIIREKREIIIVESVGDCMALWEMGRKNIICSFGTNLSTKVINYICGIAGLKKIWIALNDDTNINEELAGNVAAGKFKDKLSKLFNPDKIEIIRPPNCKDWGDFLIKKK